MPIVLLYGPGESAKRQHLHLQKQKFPSDSVTVVDLKTQDLVALQNALVTRSLFESGKRLVIAENTPKSVKIPQIGVVDSETTLLLIASNLEATSSLLKSAKEQKVELIPFEAEKEQSIFPFLDMVIEKKPAAFTELEDLLSHYGGIYIVTMLYYLLRRTVMPLPQSPFMQKKIQSQKQLLSESQIAHFYDRVLQTEFQIKSGLQDEKIALTVLVEQFLTR